MIFQEVMKKEKRVKEKIKKTAKGKRNEVLLDDSSSKICLFNDTLGEAQKRMLSSFLDDVNRHLALPKHDTGLMIGDFRNAICYLSSQGVPFEDILTRLSPVNLGGFYARPPVLWFSLDDAAKIYPLSMKQGQMAVFRLSVYLDALVMPEVLQLALDFTIKRFPSFATTLKKGVFWHYLDTSKRRYQVEQESSIPCRPLPVYRSGSQSFRVICYLNKISVEFFHVLTDGNGGLVFIKTLVGEYLRIMGENFAYEDGVLDVNQTPDSKELMNCFHRTDAKVTESSFFDRSAVQLSGKLSKYRPYRVLHIMMNASDLKQKATSLSCTVTAYVLALMFLAGKCATDDIDGISCIQVPVNMRKFYSSVTVRNFAMYCGIRIKLSDITDLPSTVSLVSQQLEKRSSRSMMDMMMNETERLVNMLRFVPLAIKSPVAKVLYGFAGDSAFSNTLSNLGVVHLPQELQRHVKSMDFVLGTALTNRASCALVTVGNIATLSISKMTSDPSFEEKLCEMLREQGIEISVEGSSESWR